MENEKIIAKIKKLFALASNNPSEEEAKLASLKAQELLAQYHIEYADVECIDLDEVEEIDEVSVELPPKKWKYQLAGIVAKNFRCRHFYCGKYRLIFYGHKTDATIAAETYKYLFDIGNRLGNKLAREARRTRGYADNVYNSCVVGFCAGIRDALAEQSKALMVIVPEDVNTNYETRISGARTMHLSSVRAYNGEAYETGRKLGYNAMKRNTLCG